MTIATGQQRASRHLYGPIDPFDQRMLDVSDGHSIYVEQVGVPDGVPVVVFHGGPGGGCSPHMRRFFNPEVFRVVLFDQRGCGRSRPMASVRANTTWDLIADAEQIRETLGIDRWIGFGGSWGATLALLYAQTHPDRVLRLVLRGVFLMTASELDWFYGGGAGKFWPELWERFTSCIPAEEQDDLIAAYHRRLFSGDRAEERNAARHWTLWENALATLDGSGRMAEPLAEYARAFARLENHYFMNMGFLDDSTAILNRLDRLAEIPGEIVQGRYDLICPPDAAWRLHRGWPKSRLDMIPAAGHALTEPGICGALVQIMDRIAIAYQRHSGDDPR